MTLSHAQCPKFDQLIIDECVHESSVGQFTNNIDVTYSGRALGLYSMDSAFKYAFL